MAIQSQKIRIRLKAFDHRVLDQSAQEIVGTAKRTVRPRPPKADLVDLIPLLDDPLGKSERLEHLDRAAGNAIRLPEFQRSGLSFDDPN